MSYPDVSILNDGSCELENGEEIKIYIEYKYLGVTFDRSGTNERELNSRIIQARKAIAFLNSVLWTEIWRLTERNRRKVNAIEMDSLRRSSRISRRERIYNEIIRQRIGIEGTITTEIERKQLTWYGHVFLWFKNYNLASLTFSSNKWVFLLRFGLILHFFLILLLYVHLWRLVFCVEFYPDSDCH
ncbi:hypothetical protein RN001_007634 [Aquatica leii]|uniref:Uncharacterized protein n=1 Tax=Aquatica leii TaxID=1421715 RepID=A0AAN7P9S5_9COLE|nr:hypothetical protein RN001_007634 [Aquatica leii]